LPYFARRVGWVVGCVEWRRPKSADRAKHRRGLALPMPTAPARNARHQHGKSLDVSALSGYKGPWWTSSELVLMRSERTPSGYRYSALGAVLLRGRS
jgi:hypothetical protein